MDLKALKKKLDYDKFYVTITSKKIDRFNPPSIIDLLHNNLGVEINDDESGFYAHDPQEVDDNTPEISIQDGSLFSFLNNKIDCKPVFISIQTDKVTNTLNAEYLFVMSFKNREKKVIASLYWPGEGRGWDMDVNEIIKKKITDNKLNEKLINRIKKIDVSFNRFTFIYKSLGLSVKKYVQHIKKNLEKEYKRQKKMLSDYGSLTELSEDFLLFLLDDKVRLPTASRFEWDDVYNAPDIIHQDYGVKQPAFVYKWPRKKQS